MKLRVVLDPSDEGGYTVTVPALPGCISEGETREEALRKIREAIELYLEPVDDDASFGSRPGSWNRATHKEHQRPLGFRDRRAFRQARPARTSARVP